MARGRPGKVLVHSLGRGELARIWGIDRRELIEGRYRLDGGAFVAEPHRFDVPGWPPDARSTYDPILAACLDRGGRFFGALDGETLVGAAVLDGQPVAAHPTLLQLVLLHVSRDHRGRGVGSALFRRVLAEAAERGAAGLYISATPSRNTIDFYRRFGAVPVDRPDPVLLALEPDDIHLVCPLSGAGTIAAVF
jgi:predicted N-acetyltransferase YhbS